MKKGQSCEILIITVPLLLFWKSTHIPVVNKITSCITLRAYILKSQKCLKHIFLLLVNRGLLFWKPDRHFVPSVSRCCLLCTRMCVTNRSSWWKWFAFIKISAHHSCVSELELRVVELLLYQAQVSRQKPSTIFASTLPVSVIWTCLRSFVDASMASQS